MDPNELRFEDHLRYLAFYLALRVNRPRRVSHPYQYSELRAIEDSSMNLVTMAVSSDPPWLTGGAGAVGAQPGRSGLAVALGTSDGHALNQDRAGGFTAAIQLIGADLDDLAEHVFQVARNGDFLHRILNLPVFHPVTECAT